MLFSLDWDLSNLVHNGAASPTEFHLYLDQIEKQIDHFAYEIPDLFGPYQKISDALHEAASVVCCMTGINTSDAAATELESRITSLAASFHQIGLKIDHLLLEMPEQKFHHLITSLPHLKFPLEERRRLAKEKMSIDKEILVSELSVSGLHGLMTLYFTYMGELRFPVDGKDYNLSKLEPLFSHDDRSIRIKATNAMEEELTKRENVFAQILNNLVDVRLRTYGARGWDDYLHETLTNNRMSKASLNAMWKAISASKAPLVKYLNAKAKLLGLPKLSWADLDASIGSSDQTKIPYQQGATSIIKEFGNVSPIMGAFAKKAFDQKWISASASETKRAGGFCTDLPIAKESRILMTYMDTFNSQSTLAHELGHAFHNEAMKDLPAMLREVPINLAETASTMCEMIMQDSAIKQAKTPHEKLILLDDKISRYCAFSMDLHSRFLFDQAFHKRRSNGFIPPQEISQMMQDAQEEGFAGALSSYFPHFWAYKMHYYLTDAPFYNWAYTFGYLFSLGVYTHLLKTGDFENKYIALLQDTGRMSVDDLAKKHLGANLSETTFWQEAIDILNQDIAEFLHLLDLHDEFRVQSHK